MRRTKPCPTCAANLARIKMLRDGIRQIIAFPPHDYHRRTRDGYPLEMLYDEYAYKRMVRSYREDLRALLKDASAKAEEAAR